MKVARNFVIFTCFIALSAVAVLAQETEVKVVDEVVAEVNDGVITLSRIKRESKDIVEAKVSGGAKREDAQKEVDEKQGEIIADMINQELLVQKSKEIGVDKEVDSAINQRLVDIMKQQGLRTIEELEGAMRAQNIEPQEMRAVWRKQLTSERVLSSEVDRKLYWGASGKSLKDYYEKNKAKFTKPEMLSMSEIFLDFSKGDPEAKRAKAKSIVSELRAGADFVKIVTEQSDRPDAAKTKGKSETLPAKDLDPKFAIPLKDVKVGGVTDPIELDGVGILILRVDERIAASNEPQFDEAAVRLAITNEGRAEGAKKYMSELRTGAFIKINEKYRPIVSPLLFAEERKSKTAN